MVSPGARSLTHRSEKVSLSRPDEVGGPPFLLGGVDAVPRQVVLAVVGPVDEGHPIERESAVDLHLEGALRAPLPEARLHGDDGDLGSALVEAVAEAGPVGPLGADHDGRPGADDHLVAVLVLLGEAGLAAGAVDVGGRAGLGGHIEGDTAVV